MRLVSFSHTLLLLTFRRKSRKRPHPRPKERTNRKNRKSLS